MSEADQVKDSVKDYYGKKLQSTGDLQTPACMTLDTPVKAIKEALSEVHEEVSSKYYGCGLVIPEKLEGMRMLDLGSGSGQDCYVVSKLVGQSGHVTGLDMTDEQLEVARKYIDYHTEKFGYSKPNIDFVKGYIEKLIEAGLQENSFDIIISNCVVNLSPDKRAVVSEAYKVLKVGGEMYFSDVYCSKDLPDSARKHKVLWGECIAGSLYWKDLYRLAKEIGFAEPRLVTASPIPIDREDFKAILGDAKFVSVTYRLFKLPADKEEGRQVIYNGEISGHTQELAFDHQNKFKEGDVVTVDSELATILSCSRFNDEFDFQPVSKKVKDINGCCATQSQEVDPFVYLEKKAKLGEKVEASCCGGKKCC